MRDRSRFFLVGIILALAAVATACGGETTPTTFPEFVSGVRIRAQENLLFLTADNIQESLAQRIAQIDGISRVDSYLEVATEPNPIVGISPGSLLRVGGEPVTLALGDGFSGETAGVAIPGINVNSNPYGFGMTTSAMVHGFQVGQSFDFQGQRLRVIGLFRAQDDKLENYILLPLSTAQRLYDLEGVVTTAVVSVDPPQKMEEVRRSIQELLEGRQ